uniref:Uncharacterized protein n=1 Tax=Magallana gigas TaxID=29159 RepID=K1QGI1_MAGGI
MQNSCPVHIFLMGKHWKFLLHTKIAYDLRVCHDLDPRNNKPGMPPPAILKRRHSLVGRNILPVRLIASQNKPSEALLLLTLEELAAKARSLGHEDAETFEEIARQATRNQGRINIMSLALTVLGGKASDIITKDLSKCMKEKDQEKEEAPQNKKHE